MMVRRSTQQPLREALHAAELASCDAGHLPPRYARNGRLTTPAQQAMLLRARVLLVGLGGLGGHVLDGLCRMGVGHITGVDGDSFEQSNLNRQLLCTAETVGQPKAQAASAHARLVNAAVEFVPVAEFVRGAALKALMEGTFAGGGLHNTPSQKGVVRQAHAGGQATDLVPDQAAGRARGRAPGKAAAQAAIQGRAFDIVVDALGGLDDRPALHSAAQKAGIPVVAAGIAGMTGWVQVIQPEETGVMSYFSQSELAFPPSASEKAGTTPNSSKKSASETSSPSAEELLGNLAPTVLVAAGLQCAHTYTLLTGGIPGTGMLLFDLQDASFQTVRL